MGGPHRVVLADSAKQRLQLAVRSNNQPYKHSHHDWHVQKPPVQPSWTPKTDKQGPMALPSTVWLICKLVLITLNTRGLL